MADFSHSIDAYVLTTTRSFLPLGGNLIWPVKATGYVRLNASLLQPTLQFVNLAATLQGATRLFVNLAASLQSPATRQYVRLNATLLPPGDSHQIDALVSITAVGSFVNLNGSLEAPSLISPVGFVRLDGYLVKQNDSVQMPGSGFSPDEDFLSSSLAGSAYKPFSLFSLKGINLIVTAFTMGVISWQTRTKSWMTLVDGSPGGVVTSTQVQKQQLPNGDVLTTTTVTEQKQDTQIITITVVDSGTPTRTSISIQEINRNGQSTSREIETNTINGVKNSVEKKNVFTTPPTVDNIQPIKVTTLDGVTHYQWFSGGGIPNEEWAGGDAEGLTTTKTQQSMFPTTLNGKSTDSFGNPIMDLHTVTTETDPTGKTTTTTVDQVGVQPNVGSTVTDTTTSFNGIITTIHKVTTYPDGSQSITDTTTNDLTGDSTTTTTTTDTDQYGQVTTTVQFVEKKTFTNAQTGQPEETVTTTTKVTVGGVTKTTVTTTTNNNFEDSIVNDKVKVYGIQEYTLECVLDQLSMNALLEVQITTQQQYALQELFGQQLGNANLSYALRQRLITQYNETLCGMRPMLLQANGKTYYVVFANSASAFRAKYIPGTEPHVYELQMILQERSDLINGTQGFG
jgi:hypothetical protein